MVNPIRDIRQNELEVSRKELAAALNVSYGAIAQVENDLTGNIYPCLLDGLEKLEYDREELLARWEKYKDQEQKDKLDELKSKVS